MPIPFPRLIPVLLALSLLPADAAPRRNREPTAAAPPQPVPLQIKATRGQEVEIPLRIYGRRNETLTFRVRQPPRSGRISEPKNVDHETGSVRYRPPDDRRIVRDSFQYAVKSADGVSAPAAVEIEIVDVAAALAIPSEITFAPRLSGTSEVQTLEIENRGGTRAEGECFVAEPWQIEGSNRYSIDPGARAVIRIRFAPTQGGSFDAEFRLSPHIDRVTTLRGSAQEPLEIAPARIVLQPEMTTLVRSGACEITNRTGEPQRVKVKLPERLRSEAEFTVPAGQAYALLLQTEPGDAAALGAKFSIEAGPLKASASVSADPLPAVIRATPGQILFRRDSPTPPVITVENAGGVAADIKIEPGPNLRADPAALALSAGAKASIALASDSKLDGWESHVGIRWAGGNQRVAVRASARTVAAVAAPPAGAGSQRASPPRAPSRSEAIAEQATTDSAPAREMPIPSFLIVRPSHRTSTSCILDWPTAITTAESFTAQTRTLSIDKSTGALVVAWGNHPAARFDRGPETTRATIEGLKPGQRYTVRIIPANAAAAGGEAIVACTFDTFAEKRRSKWVWTGLAIVLLGLGAGGFLAWNRLNGNRPGR